MDIQKLKYLIYLIEKERTGSPGEAAVKLGVSERTIYSYIKMLKSELNAPIEFNQTRKTYQYKNRGKFHWEWVKTPIQ